MSLWKQLRIPLLMFTCANALFVFGRSILDPTVGKPTVTPFAFPQVVPLASWQLVASNLENKTVEREPFGKLVLPGINYRYIQNDPKAALDIKMRYEVQTDGNVKSFIKNYTAIKFSRNQPLISLREREQIGFYGLFVYKQRAYLDACINPRGGSTFTQQQFNYNRTQYDIQFNRIVPWLFAQQKLLDKRCLWTHLSVPLNQPSPDSAYIILENAWVDWYQWWSTRFPKP